MKKRNDSVRGTAAARFVAALSGVGARVGPVLLSGGVLVVFALAALVLTLGGCRQSFDYYNPLDPAEDAPISEILPFIEDPVIRQAIIDSGAQTKRQLDRLWVSGPDHGGTVTTLEGMEFLSDLNFLQLHVVGLPGSPVVDLTVLLRNGSLSALGLRHNAYNDENVGTIPFLHNLRLFDLGGNNLTDAASVVPLVSNYGRGALDLAIDNNPIDVSTLTTLQPVFDKLRGLNIGWLQGQSLTDLSLFISNDTIEYLDMGEHSGVTDWSGLSRLSALRSVRLERVEMNDAGFQSLPTFSTEFWGLSLRGNSITDLSAVAAYVNRYQRSRVNLEIGENPFTAAALWDLAPAFENMHRLDLSWYGWWDPAFEPGPVVDLYFLPVNDTVNALHVSGNDITDISAISRLRDLEEFSMEGNSAAFISGYSSLLDLPRLRRVELWDTAYIDLDVLDELVNRGVWVDW